MASYGQLSCSENSHISNENDGKLSFIVKVDMTEVLAKENEAEDQIYAILVDPKKMETIQDIKDRIKFLFKLSEDITIASAIDYAILPNLESSDILLLCKSVRVRLGVFTRVANTKPTQVSHLHHSGNGIALTSGHNSTIEQSNQANSMTRSEQKQAPRHLKAFSVGALLDSLRSNINEEKTKPATDESFVDNPSDESFASLPSKRKRVRRHKSKASKPLPEMELDPPPKFPPTFTFENSSHPKHFRFSEVEGPEKREVEEDPIEQTTIETEITSAPMNGQNELDTLFSLRKIHGSPPIFVRTPTTINA